MDQRPDRRGAHHWKRLASAAVIRGEFVNLRAIERSDAAALFRWFNDPDVMRFWGFGDTAISLNRLQTDVAGWLEDERDLGRPAALMIESLEQDPLGIVILTGERLQDRAIELSMMIGEANLWGRGLGSDALETVVDVCFAQWNIHRISAKSEVGNVRAHRWLRRAGFLLEGTLRDASFFNNAFHDQLSFARLATDEKCGS